MWKKTIPDWLKKSFTEKPSHAKIEKKPHKPFKTYFFISILLLFNIFSLKYT